MNAVSITSQNTAVIHQPYFMPWLGFFNKLINSDVYIALDNVQFRKRHFQDRCRIINMHGDPAWISLPVGENHGKLICGVNLSYNHELFVNRFIRSIEYSYAKAQHFNLEWPDLKSTITPPIRDIKGLSELNVTLIKSLLAYLKMPCPIFYNASDFNCNSSDPTTRIIRILKHVECSAIIIGSGSSEKVHDWIRVKGSGFSVYKSDYMANHPVYEQTRRRRAGFLPGLSVIDAILNAGKEKTREYISMPIAKLKAHKPLCHSQFVSDGMFTSNQGKP